MQNIFEIKHLSKKDKLRVMEAIWADLSKEGEELESPKWHQKVLKETEQRLNWGEEEKIVEYAITRKEIEFAKNYHNKTLYKNSITLFPIKLSNSISLSRQ